MCPRPLLLPALPPRTRDRASGRLFACLPIRQGAFSLGLVSALLFPRRFDTLGVWFWRWRSLWLVGATIGYLVGPKIPREVPCRPAILWLPLPRSATHPIRPRVHPIRVGSRWISASAFVCFCLSSMRLPGASWPQHRGRLLDLCVEWLVRLSTPHVCSSTPWFLPGLPLSSWTKRRPGDSSLWQPRHLPRVQWHRTELDLRVSLPIWFLRLGHRLALPSLHWSWPIHPSRTLPTRRSSSPWRPGASLGSWDALGTAFQPSWIHASVDGRLSTTWRTGV
mmetsp:Transcript_1980/g.12537  ORF Transcript_1980/g.12537 Transcript_1980/m.12537 type:complete len:279 (-) Transcript_1980:2954-3790(-)